MTLEQTITRASEILKELDKSAYTNIAHQELHDEWGRNAALLGIEKAGRILVERYDG